MDNTMDSFKRFEDDLYKNWIKTTMGLEYLKTPLEHFLENETRTYHQTLGASLRDETDWNGQECPKECDLNKWIPKQNKIPPLECEVCAPWRDGILANHTNKDGKVLWINSTPFLWPTNKWEVAKVYMPAGQKNHKSVGDFDIAALLTLMNHCKHFRTFVKDKFLTEVVGVRNKVMHSANFRVKLEDLHVYLGRIRALGRELEEHVPEFKSLSKEIDELQNLDFSIIVHGEEARLESAYAASERVGHLTSRKILSMELQIMKEKMECLAQLCEEGSQQSLTPEELSGVRVFLEGNKDLQEKLVPQWERLSKVQEQQGQQINSLTGRVDRLERKTLIPEPKPSPSIAMHKNHLLELAKKHGWPDPVFSEIRGAEGFRGQVKIKDQIFTGSRVYRNKKQAHQEVAEIALQDPAIAMANIEVGVVDPVNQSEMVAQAGPSFFGNITVGLKIEVSPDEGLSGTELKESAYQKLAAVFGLDLSASGSSYEEAVLQYCQRCDVPPLEESTEFDHFILSGQLTFYDLKGSNKKTEAKKQAAKAALEGLREILGKTDVFQENYIGAIKELLDASRFYSVSYDVTETPGEGVGWVGDQGKGKEGTGHTVAVSSERETGIGDAAGSGQVPAVPVMQTGQPLNSQVPRPLPADTSVTHATPTVPGRARNVSGEGRQFLSCVKVAVHKQLQPFEASSQEGAVQDAYSSLRSALSLDPAAEGERQSVLEFFKQTMCRLPVEDIVSTTDGKHRCTLTIDGEFTFTSPEGASRKQQAEQLTAKKALMHLKGLLSTKQPGEKNYKGRLQELLAKHGGDVKPEYSSKSTPATATD